MSLLGYVLLLTAALCCSSAPAPDAPCPKPPRLREAALLGDWDDESYPPGEKANYQCRPGFSRLGTIRKVCRDGAWQDVPPVGQCKKRSCGHPGDIQFGSFRLTNDESFGFGAIVEYTCEDGYRMVSKETTRQCTASGWSNYLPECEVKNCPPVEAAPNVKVVSTSYDEEYTVGQVVRFECKEPSFKLDGPFEIFCTSDGDWSVKPPSCVEISCKRPDIAEVRTISPRRDVYKNNEVIQITCKEGFTLNTNREITCTKDNWMPNPSCEEITCSAYQNVKNGKLIVKKPSYKFGEQIDVECDDDYVLEHEPNKPRTCTSNGWSPAINCISKRCDRPYIKYGHFHYDYSYYFPKRIGSEIDYWCDRNYLPSERTSWGNTKCTNIGWRPEPKCLRQCAFDYAKFENVQAPYRHAVYLEGDTVTFQCKPNYKTPDGKTNVESTCLPDGEFTQVICTRTCRAPELPNGNFQPIRAEFKIGEYLQYECNSGYMTESRNLVGTAQCIGNGWIEPPNCEAITCEYNRVNYKNGDVVEYKCPRGKRPTSNTGQCYFFGWGPPLDCQDIECTIQEIGNLILSPHKTSYKFGSRVLFSCKEGFKRVGKGESLCTNEDWFPPLPSCQAIECTIPEIGNLILSSHQTSYKFGARVSFSCKEGFERVDQEESLCTSEGWLPSLPSCQVAETLHRCKILDKANIVRNPFKQNYKENDVVTVRCEAGFIPDESKNTTCTENDWDPPLPICEVAISALPHNTTRLTDESQGLDQVAPKPNFDVRPVFQEEIKGPDHISGESLVPRLDQGENNKEDSCDDPPDVPHATFLERKTIYNHGESAKYKCGDGFHASIEDLVTCVKGKWNSVPKCIEDSCDAPQDVPHANVLERKTIYNHGESAKYKCGDGFRVSKEDSATCVNGRWINVPRCIDQRKTCPPAYSPANRIITDPKEAYYSGDTVTMECASGYKIYGSPTIRCIEGKWEQPPLCIRLTPCRKPPSVTNSEIIEFYRKQKYVTDDVVKYLCKPGFHLSGTDSITCGNGQWSAPPTCIEDSCDAPPDVAHATVLERKNAYNHGESTKYKCGDGFSISKDLAICIKGKWNKVPRCTESSCKSPPNVENAKIDGETKNSYASGEKVNYLCNSGYSLERTFTGEVECKDTQWTERPVCRKIGEQCGPPPVVQFGDTIKFAQPSYKSGESVEYKCPEYYVLKGNRIVRCSNGVWDEAPVCLEPCTAKVPDMDRNNIQLKYRYNRKLYSEHGDSITFACKQLYVEPPGTQMRSVCDHGKLEYPKCFRPGYCVLQEQTMITNNILYNISNVVDQGQTITFQCNEGMTPETNLEAKCERSTINYPKCSASQSCKPPEILNGFLTSDQQASYDSGSNVEFQCNEDHVVGSPISIKCENGQWSDQPVCHRPCKLSTGDLNKYNIQLHPSANPKTILDNNHKHGTIFSVTCKSGFRRPIQTALVTECYDGKFRSSKCFDGKTCRIDQDKLDENNLELDEVLNSDGFYEDDDIVHFKCKTGFRIRGGKPTGTCSVETLTYPKCTVESSV